MNERIARPLIACFGLLAVAGILLPLGVALFGSDNLLLYAMKDDGFYYLAIARNIATGHGATFDGLGPTNGFHPLWAMLLTPIYWFRHSSPYAPARIAIVLALMLQVAAAVAVDRAARRIADRPAARVGAFFSVANPLAGYLVVSGMESALVGLLVILVANESIRLRHGDTTIVQPGTVLRLGILGGLCMLARTDLILLVGLVLAGALVFPPPEHSAAPIAARLRGAILAGACAVAVVLPWIAWNLARFGSIVQVSARAHHLHSISSRTAGEPAGLARLFSMGGSLFSGVTGALRARTGLPPAVAILALLGVLVLIAWWIMALVRRADERADLRRRIRSIDAPLLYAVGFIAAAFFVLGHIRSWYIAGPMAVMAVVGVLPAHYAMRSQPLPLRGRLASAVVFGGLVLCLLPLAVIFAREMTHNARNEHCWREAVTWVATNTQPGDRVASFNSGTFGYLSPRPVVNLDCVVNNRALVYLERRQLVAFLRENRIRYLIDDPGYVGRYFGSYGEQGWREAVVPIATLPSGLRVYEIRPVSGS
jgi:hypothetical protein